MKISYIKNIIICSLLLVLVSTCNSYAETVSSSSEWENTILSFEQASGNSAQSIEALFSPIQAMESVDTYLSNVDIGYENNLLTLRGDFTHNGNTIAIDTSGTIYKNENTVNAGTFGNLILVEMDDIEEWHFVQFRIDKDDEQICIILQNTSSKELVHFLLNIDRAQYDTLYSLQGNPIQGTALEEKVLSLYNVSKNLLNMSTVEAGTGESPVYYPKDHEMMSSRSTYQG